MELTTVLDVLHRPLFVIGNTDITSLRVTGLVLIMCGVWWGSSLVERSIRSFVASRHPDSHESSGVYALAKITRYVIWIVGSVVGLNFIGFDLASLALLGGAIGVGIGLGLQSIFANFLSGIILLLDRTLKVGDYVDLQSGVMGTVAEISMRYTRVTTNDNVDVIVPNSEFVNGRVVNWTLDDRRRRVHIAFGVAYGSKKEIVREAGIAAALRVAGTINTPGQGLMCGW